MLCRRTWPAVGICALLALVPAAGIPGNRDIKGVVETMDGKPVARVEVRVTNVGGTLSSDSGEFTIPLPSQLEPGDPILFRVKDWVVIDPFVGASGRTYVPRSSVEPMKIVVARKGDPGLLSNRQLIQQIIQGVTSQIGPNSASPRESDHFLADQAKELGFTVEQLKLAITAWSKSVQEPYQKGLAALYARRYPEASAYIQQSISSSETDLVSKYSSLALAQYGQGHCPAAETALRKAYALHSDDPLVLNFLGVVLDAEAKYSEAEPLYQRALSIDEKVLGPEHPTVAEGLSNLARLYADQGKYAEAEPLFKRALVIHEKALGPEHPDVARDLNNLAALYDDQGRYAEAEPLFKRALVIHEKALGSEHPAVARDLNNLAVLYVDQGRYAEAEPLAKRALVIDEKALGPEHADVANDLSNLARLYELQGKYTEAEPLAKRALVIDEKALGPEHPDVARDLNNLATLYADQGKYAEAEPLYQRALAIDEKALGLEHPDVARDLDGLARLYELQDKYTEAEPLTKRALAIDDKVLGPEHPDVAAGLNNLAALYDHQGKYAEAEPLFKRALAIDEKALGPDNPTVATMAGNLALLLRKLGHESEAKVYEDQAARIRAKTNQEPKAGNPKQN